MRILRGFLESDEFGLCGGQALRLQQQIVHDPALQVTQHGPFVGVILQLREALLEEIGFELPMSVIEAVNGISPVYRYHSCCFFLSGGLHILCQSIPIYS